MKLSKMMKIINSKVTILLVTFINNKKEQQIIDAEFIQEIQMSRFVSSFFCMFDSSSYM